MSTRSKRLSLSAGPLTKFSYTVRTTNSSALARVIPTIFTRSELDGELERPAFQCRFVVCPNVILAEAVLASKAAFHLLAQRGPGLRQLAGDRRFVLAEESPDIFCAQRSSSSA